VEKGFKIERREASEQDSKKKKKKTSRVARKSKPAELSKGEKDDRNIFENYLVSNRNEEGGLRSSRLIGGRERGGELFDEPRKQGRGPQG